MAGRRSVASALDRLSRAVLRPGRLLTRANLPPFATSAYFAHDGHLQLSSSAEKSAISEEQRRTQQGSSIASRRKQTAPPRQPASNSKMLDVNKDEFASFARDLGYKAGGSLTRSLSADNAIERASWPNDFRQACSGQAEEPVEGRRAEQDGAQAMGGDDNNDACSDSHARVTAESGMGGEPETGIGTDSESDSSEDDDRSGGVWSESSVFGRMFQIRHDLIDAAAQIRLAWMAGRQDENEVLELELRQREMHDELDALVPANSAGRAFFKDSVWNHLLSRAEGGRLGRY
ncbi:hypothetical protein CKAH01_13788 [Colletotrichum kahawae]|uniref:Uncharacterized protein n=1 Tax=Colletotrichum kahawae TaxID=34407 RepID=A0AAD9YMR4_COLKA|nr:hypothetical protein CKAH01_13788 [Colletotrichum kahawae]